MRGLKIGKRSVYRGLKCMHCHRKVHDGSAVLASTFYVCARYPKLVHTQSQGNWLKRSIMFGTGRTVGKVSTSGYPVPVTFNIDDVIDDEIEVRVVYHRRCIEKILLRAPVDPEVEEADFDAYRLALMERFGIDDPAEVL